MPLRHHGLVNPTEEEQKPRRCWSDMYANTKLADGTPCQVYPVLGESAFRGEALARGLHGHGTYKVLVVTVKPVAGFAYQAGR